MPKEALGSFRQVQKTQGSSRMLKVTPGHFWKSGLLQDIAGLLDTLGCLEHPTMLLDTLESYRILQDVVVRPRTPQDTLGCCWKLQDPLGLSKTLQDVKGHSRIFLDTLGSYGILQVVFRQFRKFAHFRTPKYAVGQSRIFQNALGLPWIL